MRRREFITLLGAAAAWPLSARAQQAGKIYRIGFLANDPTIPNTAAGTAFLEGLREGGFIEGKNILVDWRFAEGRGDRYAHLAETFVRLQMDLIVTSAVSATIAAKQATRNIPIVMLNVADPVGQGIIASLAFPEANITGLVQDESPEIAPKRLQLLKDALPQISRVAVLMQPDASYAQSEWKVLEPAARSLRMTLQAIAVRRINEFEGAFIGMTRDRPDALLVSNSELNFTHRRLILQFAGESRLPTISWLREFTELGGLMSYGVNRVDSFRRAAAYVAKILKGAKPADLPVEQPTKFELVINLKTAKTLGLTIPRELLLIVDEVIE
jgi:putative tryptophan/tyrosine transport system substrate-binding protein